MERRAAKRSRCGEREGDGRTAQAPTDRDGISAMDGICLGPEILPRSDGEGPSHYSPKTTTSIDWRYELCHFLRLDPNTSDNAVFHELQAASARMKEAERVKEMSVAHQGPPRHQVVHIVFCGSSGERVLYLEEPWTVRAGSYHAHLRGSDQVNNMDLYLERNKDVSFLVIREYACCQTKSYSTERHGLESDTDTAPMTMLVEEHIDVVSHTLRSMLASLSHAALQGILHPRFSHDRGDDSDGINESDNNFKSRYNYYNARKNLRVSYPYLWFYHRRQEIAEAIDHLEEAQRKHLSIFCRYIRDRMFEEWSDVDKLVAESQITAKYIQYIFIPGEIVLSAPQGSAATKLQASLVTDWLQLDNENSDRFSPSIPAASWSFDRRFQKNESSLHIGDLPSLSHSFNICELNPYPIQFSHSKLGITESLRDRGKMFWKCRGRNYVCFKSFVDDGIKTATDSRFMIDIETLQQMHPKEHKATNRDDLSSKVLSDECRRRVFQVLEGVGEWATADD